MNAAGAPALETTVAAADRRSHLRVPADQLSWIREVRLKYGPRVSLVDVSDGGALVQTDVRLRPGAELVMEIVGPQVHAVPFRVLRSELARISEEGAIYRGACEFKRPLNLAEASISAAQGTRCDIAIKSLLDRRRNEASLARATGVGRELGDLGQLLKGVQASVRADDPLSRSLQDILSEVVPALTRGEPAAVLRSKLESRLRRAVPAAGIAIGSSPAEAPPGAETIYFEAQGTSGPGVLNVQLPAGYHVSDWEFRLFQVGSYLLELLPSSADTADGLAGTETVPDSQSDPVAMAALAPAVAAAAPGWRKIVVRYRDGHLSKGFTHDFHPSRNQFSLWPSLDAAPSERMFVPASQLKAVFFVRDFQGNADYVEQRTFDGPAEGRRIEVTFADDEVLVGSTLNYRTDGQGFFLTPADSRGNNLRVFVVSSAIRHVRFL
jgi:Family of unknown function (DUF6982)